MAHRRMIDTRIWEDEHFGQLSDKAKILFISCITNADDEGRLSANLANLKANTFRFDGTSLRKIVELLREIQRTLNNFKLYSINGCDYIELARWNEYQTIREDRKQPSKIPPFSESLPQDGNQAATKWQPNVGVDKIRLDKIRLEEYGAQFIQFWIDYPKRWIKSSNRYVKIGKHDAWLEWQRLTAQERELSAAAVKREKQGEFVPDAHRWLKHKRFNDFSEPTPPPPPTKPAAPPPFKEATVEERAAIKARILRGPGPPGKGLTGKSATEQKKELIATKEK